MIPVPVVAPRVRSGGFDSGGTVMAWIAGLLLFGAFIGAATWYLVVAPTAYVQFEATPGYARVQASQGQTYVVAAEGIGVLEEVRPPPVTVTVRSVGGDSLNVRELTQPGEEVSAPSYDLLGREGRAIATFVASQDGIVLVSVSPIVVGRDDTGYAPVTPPAYAVGRESGVTWWGSWAGLAVMGGLPLLLGGWLTTVAVRARRGANRPATPDDAGARNSWTGP